MKVLGCSNDNSTSLNTVIAESLRYRRLGGIVSAF